MNVKLYVGLSCLTGQRVLADFGQDSIESSS